MRKAIRTISILWALNLVGCQQITSKKHTVEIRQMKFVPAEITVRKGDTVVWINRDIFVHNVAEFDNNKWQSTPLEKNQTWSKTITSSEDYFCTLHVVMKGKIKLKND